MQNKVLFVFLCRSLELALGKLWSCILMLLKIININSDYPSISSHLQVCIDLVVQDNNNRQRHDVLDHAGEQSVPDPVLCMKGISIVPILQINNKHYWQKPVYLLYFKYLHVYLNTNGDVREFCKVLLHSLRCLDM